MSASEALATAANERPPYLDALEALGRRLPGGPEWFEALRARGRAAYEAEGLPHHKTEAWKYTRIDKVGPFTHADLAPPAEIDGARGADFGLDSWRVVVVNGHVRPELSVLEGLPDSVTVAGMIEMVGAEPERLEPHLGRVLSLEKMPLAALNTAYLGDGAFIHVPRGVALDKPLQIVSLTAAGEEPVMVHPRHLVVLEDGAAATLVETHLGGGQGFANTVMEVVLGRDARLAHAKLQDESPQAVHVAACAVRLGENAAYDGLVLHTGGRLARHELRAEIAGPHASCTFNGAVLAAGQQHMDTTTFVDHAVPDGKSQQNVRAVLDHTARGVYQGKVLVRRDAQRTDAHQLSRALLLARGAEMDAKPELEIYADDVKCGHGAATGELDPDHLFYLRGRGIDPATARRMLLEAFVAEVIDPFPDAAVREMFAGRVGAWLDAHAEAAR